MTVDSTALLEALKHPQSEPAGAEKIEAANELLDWLTKKEDER